MVTVVTKDMMSSGRFDVEVVLKNGLKAVMMNQPW